MAIRDYIPRVKWFANWAVPIDTSIPTGSKLEELVGKIVSEDKNVRDVLEQNPEKEAELKKQLGYIIQDSYNENKNLRRLSQYIDTMDKALVPFDVIADFNKILMGLSPSLAAGKEMIEMGPKLAYMAYYTAKTKDFIGSLGNLLYEGLSWFIPGSILDLTNRYVKQADKYVLKNAAGKFLEKVGAKEPKKAEVRDSLPSLKPSFA